MRVPRTPIPLRQLTLLLLIPCLAAALLAPPARAGGCEGCPAPSLEQLQAQPGFKIEFRPVGSKEGFPDFVYTDAGACNASMVGTPDVQIDDGWLVLRGQGEVWHCPHSKSIDTITIETRASDRTEWSFSTKLSTELGVVGASMKAEVQAGRTTGRAVTEVTTVSKTIAPSYCHRILWRGLFEVVRLKATAEYRFTRTWAWWTKNVTTGAKVHASGKMQVACGSGRLEMERTAPISGHFELVQRGCDDEGCGHVVQKQLGLFPPWTPPHKPKGSGDEPEEPREPADPAEEPAEDDPEEPAEDDGEAAESTEQDDEPLEDGPTEDPTDAPLPGGENPPPKADSSAKLPPPPTGPLPDPLVPLSSEPLPTEGTR